MKKKEFTKREIKEASVGLTDEQAEMLAVMMNSKLNQERDYMRLVSITNFSIVVFAFLSYIVMVVLFILKERGIL